jgi:hypothetical protein
MPRGLARALLLCIVPLAALGPALLPGRRLLPLAPDAFEPLASETPVADARERENLLAVDALFPLLSDRLVVRERVLNADLPLWEERLGLGAPLLGGTLTGPLYPPGALRLILPPDLAASWHALLALFLAGLGMWLFLENRGLQTQACAVGAIALQSGGWALANLQLGPKVDAALWLPWMLWAIDGVLERRRAAGLALFLATAFALLAGFPSIAIFACAAALAYALARGFGQLRPLGELAGALGFLALGVAGAAVQLGPTWSASRSSLRGPLPAEEVAGQALPLGTSLSLAMPHLFGEPDSALPADRDPLSWFVTQGWEKGQAENANALEWDLFAGVGVLILAASAVLSRPKRALFPLLLSLSGLAFAQGWPGVAELYAVPGLNLGAPSRAAALCWVAWAWLAALGADALVLGAPRARMGALLACVAVGAVASAALASVDLEQWASSLQQELAARFEVPESQVAARVDVTAGASSAARVERAWIHAALAAGAVGCAVLFAGFRRPSSRRGEPRAWAALAALVAVEGLWVGWPHLAPRAAPENGLFAASEGMAALKVAAAGGRVLRLDESPSGVDDVLRLARPNLPQMYDIADLTPYVAFPDRRTVELLESIDPRSRYRSGASRLSDPRLLDHPVLDALRVSAVLSSAPVDHPSLEPAFEREGFRVYRRSGALPTAWVVANAVEAPSDSTALGLLATRTVDPRTQVVLAPGAAAGPAAQASAEFVPGELDVRRPSPERLEVDVRGSTGGWLVLSEAWDPGWIARVDGARTPLVRADHALRALRLPPGDSFVRLAYRPLALRIGAAVSLIAFALALWVTFQSDSEL